MVTAKIHKLRAIKLKEIAYPEQGTFRRVWKPFLSEQRTSLKALDGEMECVLASELLSQATSWVPKELLYFSREGAQRYYPAPDTTGTAAHFDERLAIRGAFLELVEKSCLAAMWLGRTARRRFELGGALSEYKVAYYCIRAGLRVKLFDISFQVPFYVIFSIVDGLECEPRFGMGCSASTCFEVAVQRSISEAISLGIAYRGDEWRSSTYRRAATRAPADVFPYLYEMRATCAGAEKERSFRSAAREFMRDAGPIYIYRYTARRPSEWKVVKAVAPGLPFGLVTGWDFAANRSWLLKMVGRKRILENLAPSPFP
jgi:ribosomal protein S12 methylthiotransferase accessory factor YcaO